MTSFPSLQCLSAVKVAVVICTNVNVKKDLFCVPESDDLNLAEWLLKEKGSWDGVTDSTVVNLLKDVSLPRTVLDIISFHFRSVVRVTWKWFRYLRFCFDIDHGYCVELLKASLFTSSGRLDRQAAVREMLGGGRLAIGKRFALAFLFLTTDDAGPLCWRADEKNWIPYFLPQYIRSNGGRESRRMSSVVYHLPAAVKQLIKNKCNANVTDELWTEVIEGVAELGSDVPVKYYWQKWHPSGSHQAAVGLFCSLVRSIQPPPWYCDWFCVAYLAECVAEILTFLLSQMEEHHKVSILEEDMKWDGKPAVLCHLLENHCEIGFRDMLRLSWSIVKESEFEALLCKMASHVGFSPNWFKCDGLSICDYRKLLQEFWKQCPTTFKRYVYGNATLFWFLVSHSDKELIAFLLKDATLEEKLSIMFFRSPRLIHNLCEWSDTKLANDLLDCIFPSQTEKRKHLLKAFKDVPSHFSAASICKDPMAFYNFVEVCLQFEDESTKAELRKSVLRKMSNDIVVRLLEQGKVEKVDSFLQWYLSTPEEISAFKTEFLEKCSPGLRSKLIRSQRGLTSMQRILAKLHLRPIHTTQSGRSQSLQSDVSVPCLRSVNWPLRKFSVCGEIREIKFTFQKHGSPMKQSLLASWRDKHHPIVWAWIDSGHSRNFVL